MPDVVCRIKAQAGVTLIEAIVAMMLFSIGALGLASMQFASLSSSGDSQQRTLAIWKAQEFADRIRSNPGSVPAYLAAINNSNLGDLGVNTPNAAAGMVNCEGGGVYDEPAVRCSDYVAAGQTASTPAADCTDDQTVAFDIWDVFCESLTGASPLATASDSTTAGSAGLTQLQVFLRQIFEDNNGDGTDDGTGELELFFEWVSRAAENDAGITNTDESTGAETEAVMIPTSLCSLTGSNQVDVNSRLDTYCLKFRF